MPHHTKRLDEKFMRKCISLAEKAGKTGDLPFGALVVLKGKIIGQGYNLLQQNKEVNAHAEIIALRQAQEKMQTRILSDCTLYSTVEPCPMCSFPTRELHIPRVVFGLSSPIMGGYTRFGVLQDRGLSDNVLDYFGQPPEIIMGILKKEVAVSWKRWQPKVWETFLRNGVFA